MKVVPAYHQPPLYDMTKVKNAKIFNSSSFLLDRYISSYVNFS